MEILNQIAQELTESDKPVVKVLYNISGKKLIAIGLAKNVLLKEHVAPGKAKIMVVQRVINFNISEENHRLERFDDYDIPLNIMHSVTGIEDAIFLLLVNINNN